MTDHASGATPSAAAVNAQRTRTLTIIEECDNATNALAAGILELSSPGWNITQHGATFTSLAVGVERLSKLCIGVASLDETGQWPNVREYGHGILTLLEQVDHLIESRIALASHSSRITSLRQHLQDDIALGHVFSALSAWAQASGRYGALNSLAGKTAHASQPVHLWENAERAAATPAILAALAEPSGAGLTQLRRSLAESVLVWWLLIYRTWAHGLFGTVARELSSGLDPTRPPAIRDFSRQALAGR